MSNNQIILTNCIMRFDTLHFALLVAIVLLAVYGFGSFRERYANSHAYWANLRAIGNQGGWPGDRAGGM